MALFRNRPQLGEVTSYYTVGLGRTVLLVGLGNPGQEYEQTRHNIGFACLDSFVAKTDEMSDWKEKKDLKCLESSGQLGQTRVIAIKPTTYMNNSGEAVRAAMSFYKIPLENVVIIYDELDIDFGHIRTRVGGSSAGHNGIKSITAAAGENSGRIRIGIGPKKPARMETSDFVLQKFSAKELAHLPELTREVNAILSEYLYSNGAILAETRSFLV